MESEKHAFSVGRNTPIITTLTAEFSYEGVVLVLKPGTNVEGLRDKYYLLEAVMRRNPLERKAGEVYFCTDGCSLCTTQECTEGPHIASGGVPRSVALQRPVEFVAATGTTLECLVAGEGETRVSIPILAGAAGGKFAAGLAAYLEGARIQQPVEFHVFRVSSAPPELARLTGKLIAIPAIPALPRDADGSGPAEPTARAVRAGSAASPRAATVRRKSSVAARRVTRRKPR